MKYSDLAEVYERLESTTKRIEKTLIVCELLEKLSPSETEKAVLLLEGRVFPSWDQRELGVAGQMMLKAISLASGAEIKAVQQEWKKAGDLGKVAGSLISRKKQATLHREELSVSKVFDNLRKLPEITGQGSVERKVQLISELLTSAAPKEAMYVVRTILQTMRVGIGAGIMRDAITWAYFPKVKGLFEELDRKSYKNILETETSEIKDIHKYDAISAKDEKTAREIYNSFVAEVQQAYDLTNDFAEVAAAIHKNGVKGLSGITLKIGIPVKAMLALKVDSVEEGFENAGKPLQAEFKLDGFRVQIHRKGNDAKIFTRRLENVTRQFPEIVEFVKKNVKGDNYILDAEAAGFDPKTRKYLPFQSISQRIKRKYDIEKMAAEFPVEVNVFDVIAYSGKSLIEEPFRKRRELIEKIITPAERKIMPVPSIVTDSEEKIEKFFIKSKELGNEGLMLKNLDAPYKPGARVGYMLKYKKTMETLDLVIVKAEWGEGKRSKWLSSYTVACRSGSNLLEIGKVSTGLKEKPEEGLSFGEMTKLLKPLIIKEEEKTATVKPKIVIEVAFEEIQRSPTYDSGYALRFPRVIGLRIDKSPEDASTLRMVEKDYNGQKKSS